VFGVLGQNKHHYLGEIGRKLNFRKKLQRCSRFSENFAPQVQSFC